MVRVMIEIGPNIFVQKNLLSSDQCNEFIRLSENIGYKAADVDVGGRRKLLNNIRNNERVDYFSRELSAHLWMTLGNVQLPSVEAYIPVSFSPYFRFYKYQPGQKFNFHKDGQKQYEGSTSFYTVLVYLNDCDQGGATLFRENNIKVQPSRGSILLFKHDLWHSGGEISEGLKYVLRTDLLYSTN